MIGRGIISNIKFKISLCFSVALAGTILGAHGNVGGRRCEKDTGANGAENGAQISCVHWQCDKILEPEKRGRAGGRSRGRCPLPAELAEVSGDPTSAAAAGGAGAGGSLRGVVEAAVRAGGACGRRGSWPGWRGARGGLAEAGSWPGEVGVGDAWRCGRWSWRSRRVAHLGGVGRGGGGVRERERQGGGVLTGLVRGGRGEVTGL
ncbi:hypothetical protein Taro_024530 [Colocasia esculenta]|uniref:Uncharacterized protein n=1 Tax=Colocasia esculenta TaxID=4460 RepID=A0A843V7Q7_COLES|nr:hypothetical protein [Colocasia esculenta]